MNSIQETIAYLKDILDRLPAEANDGGWEKSDRKWTERLREQSQNYGARQGYEVRPFANAAEWLYDSVWLLRREDGCLLSTHLVLESEWSPTEPKILEDFEKLLLAKSELKVMVFNRRNNSLLEQSFNDLEHRIKAYSQRSSGEHYFLAGLSWQSGVFEYREVCL